ncbi:MAG TPA: (Fe-S)-binding protein [Methanomassiliicoccales archaeon]
MGIVELLPGFNCGQCGLPNCRRFAAALGKGSKLEDCSMLSQERYAENLEKLRESLERRERESVSALVGGGSSDVILAPLPGEPSCREHIFPFDREAKVGIGDKVSYRCLGCPIVHFAQVIALDHSILTVQVIGPQSRIGIDERPPVDVGICMVAAFEGVVMNDKILEIGETVRFIPHRCMMQKVHSGVVVKSEGDKVRIESVDLKVWG